TFLASHSPKSGSMAERGRCLPIHASDGFAVCDWCLPLFLDSSCSTRRSAPGQLLSRLRSSLCPLSRVMQAQHRACGAMSMLSPTRSIFSQLAPGLEGCLHSCCCCGPPAGDESPVGMI